MSKTVIVKVQLPVDQRRMREEGKLWPDRQALILIYAEGRRFQRMSDDPRLWRMMDEALEGEGVMKAFCWARLEQGELQIDVERGFAPDQDW